MKSLPVLLLCVVVMFGGCSTWQGLTGLSLRSQSPETPEPDAPETGLVGNLAVAFNVFPLVVENVGLVTGLKGTGSDPRPSPPRTALMGEMHTRGVASPNTVLASKDNSLVLVRGILRPGIQKGDRFDLEVRIPSQSETTSLRGGHLLETGLKELAVLKDNAIHSGHTYGLGEGPVLVDPSADQKTDRVLLGRGRVLGGGLALKSRPLGLALQRDHQSVGNTMRIETAINRRFHIYDKGGIKVGVAKAKTDKYLELQVHPRYKDNIHRYMAVVRSVPLRDSETECSGRLRLLEKQLFDPISSARASLQLEAIGRPAVPVLLKGIESKDPEIRFYSAEVLAYLDETKAAAPLGEAARNEPAFRVFALTALSTMDDFAAAEQLHELLKSPSAETRYGAFRALWTMNPNDPLIKGEQLGKQFSYHLMDGSEPSMIHVTRSRRAEIVLFGRNQRFMTPLAVEAGNRIMVTGSKPGEIAVSKFAVAEPDQKRVVSDRVDDVVRAIVELGGTYPDVVQALQQAKAAGLLAGRLEVDALPAAGRTYDRGVAEGSGSDGAAPATPVAQSPIPDLYTKVDGSPPHEEGDFAEKPEESDSEAAGPKAKPGPVRSFFDRIMGRSSG